MAILDGVEALLSTGGIFYNEFIDETQDIRFSGIPRDATREAAMLIESNGTETVSFNLRLLTTPHTDYDALGFLLLINNEKVNFRYYPANDLAGNMFHTLSHRDINRGLKQESARVLKLKHRSSECVVKLQVFRLQKPPASATVYPINDHDKGNLVKGQMIRSRTKNDKDNHLIVNDNVSGTTCALFVDGGNRPWLSFRWKCQLKVTLEKLLLIPREPAHPDYSILPDPKLCSSADLATPIGNHYTKDFDLATIDNLALKQLKDQYGSKDSSGQDWFALARTYNNGRDIMHLQAAQIMELAKYELTKPLLVIAHNLSLHVLACVKNEDPSEYANAAMKVAVTADPKGLSDKASDMEKSHFAYAYSKVENTLYGKELRDICQKQILCHHSEVWQLPYGQVVLYAVKKTMEERYLKAKVYVLRALAEERLRKEKSESQINPAVENANANGNSQFEGIAADNSQSSLASGDMMSEGSGGLQDLAKKRPLDDVAGKEASASKRRELDPEARGGARYVLTIRAASTTWNAFS